MFKQALLQTIGMLITNHSYLFNKVALRRSIFSFLFFFFSLVGNPAMAQEAVKMHFLSSVL